MAVRVIFCPIMKATSNLDRISFKNYTLISTNKDNINYYRDKYYNSFLNSVGIVGNECIHYKYVNQDLQTKYKYLTSFGIDISYEINSSNIYSFRNGIIIGAICININNSKENYEIIEFLNHFRIITNELSSPIIKTLFTDEILNEFYFLSPTMKSFLLINENTDTVDENIFNLAFQYGTLSSGLNNLYKFSDSYVKTIIDDNSLHIYDNWVMLCTEDVLVRIYCNIEVYDKFDIWKSEYLLLYIQVIYLKYYSFLANEEYKNIEGNLEKARLYKSNFMKFQNHMFFERISVKFLPNAIYTKIVNAFDIKKDIELLNQKIERLNELESNFNQERLNKLLIFLTFLTLISVSIDGSSIIKEMKESNPFYQASSFLILTCIIIILSVLYVINKRK